jgi:hypothetical protein
MVDIDPRTCKLLNLDQYLINLCIHSLNVITSTICYCRVMIYLYENKLLGTIIDIRVANAIYLLRGYEVNIILIVLIRFVYDF